MSRLSLMRSLGFGLGFATGPEGVISMGWDDTYQSVTAWYVDEANSSGVASDANSGASSGAPLLTLRELARRLQGRVSVSITITLMSAPVRPPCLALVSTPLAGSTLPLTVTITGTYAVALSGTFTASGTAESTNVAPSVTDTNVADWSTYVGKPVYFTGGTGSGSMCVIAKDMTAGVARCTQVMVFATQAAGTLPSSSTTYEVRTPLAMPAHTRLLFDGTLRLEWLDFSTSSDTSHVVDAENVNFVGCKTPSPISIGTPPRWNCYGCTPTANGAVITLNGYINLSYCLVNAGDVSIGGYGARMLLNRTLVQGRKIIVGGTTGTGTSGGYIAVTQLGIFDSAGQAAVISAGAQAQIIGTLYGSGSATGVLVQTGATAIVHSSATPTLASTSAELSIDGVSPLPTNANSNAGTAGALPFATAACTTWAEWVSNHSRNVTSFKTGAKVISW